MIYLYNKELKKISVIGKDDIREFTTTEELNSQWIVEISYPFSLHKKEAEYIGFKDNNEFKLYKIINTSRSDDFIDINGVHIFFHDLKGKVIRDVRPNNKTALQVATEILKDTDWQVFSTAKGLNTTNFYYISKLDAFYDLLEKWQCEFRLETYFDGNKFIKKIYLEDHISKDYGRWFEYGDKLLTVIAEENHSNVFTAFIGRGKGEETDEGGFGRKIKFDTIHWSIANGNPVNKPVGQDYVEIKEATRLYGYPDGKPRIAVVDFNDEEDRENLLKLTYEYALENSRPKLQLKATAVDDKKVELGEVCAIIRPNLDIRYKTRIFKVKTDRLSDLQEFEFGDKIVISRSDRIRAEQKTKEKELQEIESRLEQALKNVDFDFNNEDGYNYDLKAGNKYNLPAGYYSFNKPIDENPTKVTYLGAGKVLIADEKGSDGSWKWKTAVDGNGIYGGEIIGHSITANKLASDVGQSLDLSSNKSITLKVQSETKDYIDANKDQLKGEKGADGKDGTSGVGFAWNMIKGTRNLTVANVISGSDTTFTNNPDGSITYQTNTTSMAYSVTKINDLYPVPTDLVQEDVGKDFVFSIEMKSDKLISAYIYLGIVSTGYVLLQELDKAVGKWHRVWSTAKASTINNIRPHIQINTLNANISFRNPMLHLGTTPAPYAPHISEIQGEEGIGIKHIEPLYAYSTSATPDFKANEKAYNSIDLFDKTKLTGLPMHPVNTSLPFLELTLAPNTQYTLSTNIPKATDGVQFDLFFDLHDVGANSSKNGVAIKTPRTITSDETGKVWIIFGSQAFVDKVISGEYWVKLEKGSEATPRVEDVGQEILWTSYGVGKNIINDSATAKSSGKYQVGSFTYNDIIYGGEQYTASINGDIGGDATGWYINRRVGTGYPAVFARAGMEKNSEGWYVHSWTARTINNQTPTDIGIICRYPLPPDGGDGNISTVRRLKIERGDIPTPYTISPADHEARKTEYLWERQMIIFTDGRIELTEPSPVHLAKDGAPGKDGIGITSTTIEYAVNQSGTTKPTAGWSGTVPKTNPGDYIWTKTTWKYTDNTSEEAYSVGRIGANGADGNDGLPGAPGVGIKKTTITYAKSTSGTVIPPSTATWLPSPPAGNPGEFIWTKTVWTYTNNETEEGYSVGMIGKTGARGAKGDKGDKGDTGEADYTQFRTEFSSELNVLSNQIQSIVESTNTSSEDTLNALSELNQSLNGLTSEEDVQKLIDELNSKINQNKLEITQTNDSFTQEYSRIEASIENNRAELEKLTGVIQSGLDSNGNTYTDWIGDDENRVRVGSDGIVMLSNNAETLKLKDGRGYMNSLYVEHELGLGNHTARKMGTEFTVFMPIGGQK